MVWVVMDHSKACHFQPFLLAQLWLDLGLAWKVVGGVLEYWHQPKESNCHIHVGIRQMFYNIEMVWTILNHSSSHHFHPFLFAIFWINLGLPWKGLCGVHEY